MRTMLNSSPAWDYKKHVREEIQAYNWTFSEKKMIKTNFYENSSPIGHFLGGKKDHLVNAIPSILYSGSELS